MFIEIKQRDEQCIILCENSGEKSVEAEPAEDDPYADYSILDDLMW